MIQTVINANKNKIMGRAVSGTIARGGFPGRVEEPNNRLGTAELFQRTLSLNVCDTSCVLTSVIWIAHLCPPWGQTNRLSNLL